MNPRTSRRLRALAAVAVAALLAGCATTQVKTESGDTTRLPDSLVDEIAFDHGCQPPGLTVLRWNSPIAHTASSYDLNVCGQIRRYKRLGEPGRSWVWVDVTALYPPGSLPSPGK